MNTNLCSKTFNAKLLVAMEFSRGNLLHTVIKETLNNSLFRGVFRTLSNNYDKVFLRKQWFLIIYYFRKKAQSQILTVFYIHIRYGYLLTRISVLRGVNRRNIFLEKSYIKCGEETIPRHFSKKSKLSEYLDQQSSVLQLVFVVGQVEGYQYILKLN